MDKSKFEKYLKWGIGIGCVIAAGSLALLVLQSLVSIIACGVVGLAAINFAPVIAQKFASWKILALKDDAMKNPIPNLIQALQTQQRKFANHKLVVTQFNMTIRNFKSKTETFRAKNSPGVVEMEKMYENMKRALMYQMSKLEEAQISLKSFERTISEAQDSWDISMELIAANRAMSVFTDLDPIEVMKTKTSLDSVQSRLNQSMAELETSLTLDYKSLPSNLSELDVVSGSDLTSRLQRLEV